jgi:hypothetical protein
MSDPYPAAEAPSPSAKSNRPRLLDRLLSLMRREPEDREGIVTVLDAARERNLIDADALLLLTDQQGMYREDPRRNPDAELLQSCDVHDPGLDAMAGEGEVRVGGKVCAALFSK